MDIETRSRFDLKKVGVYKYVTCPDFAILMCAWAVDDGPVEVLIGEREIRQTLQPYLTSDYAGLSAFNSAFERVCFSKLLGMPVGKYLPPDQWDDPMIKAAIHGYPNSLDGAAKALGAQAKDSAGTRLINLFSKPNRQGEFNSPEDYPDEWLEFVMYCAQDVETMRDVAKRLPPWPNHAEREAWIADQYVNDRGFKIDVPMAKLAEAASLENKADMIRESVELTGLSNPNSVQQLSGWLRAGGIEVPNLQAETVERLLAGDELDPTQRRVLEIRQELALAAASKYTAALDTVSPDGRVRGSFRFFGAHTGRWAGGGMQPHNMPRLAFEERHEEDAAILDLHLGLGGSQTTLKKLVRPLLVGPFTVVDYAAIEARVVAWLAGEAWALHAFEDGRDIYVETAQRMGGLTRFQGKVAVLALGYNGGINSLRAMGAEGDDDELREQVQHWRAANKRIVRLWRTMGNAVENGGPVGDHLYIRRRGDTMLMHLPSGRAITYHGMKYGKYVVITKDEEGNEIRVFKESWRYRDPKRNGALIGTYGGRLVENATQAIARDILSEAIVRLEKQGYRVAAHVHDEVIVEGEHDVELISKIICEPPSWAKGLPIAGEGFVTQRYRKG